jgi:hypothetical protein
MHSPVNHIAVNEIYRGRIAAADAARLARENKPAAEKAYGPRRSGLKWLRRGRLAY